MPLPSRSLSPYKQHQKTLWSKSAWALPFWLEVVWARCRLGANTFGSKNIYAPARLDKKQNRTKVNFDTLYITTYWTKSVFCFTLNQPAPKRACRRANGRVQMVAPTLERNRLKNGFCLVSILYLRFSLKTGFRVVHTFSRAMECSQSGLR